MPKSPEEFGKIIDLEEEKLKRKYPEDVLKQRFNVEELSKLTDKETVLRALRRRAKMQDDIAGSEDK